MSRIIPSQVADTTKQTMSQGANTAKNVDIGKTLDDAARSAEHNS